MPRGGKRKGAGAPLGNVNGVENTGGAAPLGNFWPNPIHASIITGEKSHLMGWDLRYLGVDKLLAR